MNDIKIIATEINKLISVKDRHKHTTIFIGLSIARLLNTFK
jgi:hypothetical protein